MLRALLIGLFSIYAASASTDVCQDSNQLLKSVFEIDPIIQAERNKYRAMMNRDTEEYSFTGASVSIKIPLTARVSDAEQSKALSDLAKVENQRRKSILDDLNALCNARSKLVEIAERKQMLADKVQWQKRRVEEGYDDPSKLWGVTEKLIAANSGLSEAAHAERSALNRFAVYGGDRWDELKTMLDGEGKTDER